MIETIAILISIAAIVAVVIGYRKCMAAIKKIEKQPVKLEDVEIEKLSLPGFDIKVEGGKLSINPKP